MQSYVPNTPKERQEMLCSMGFQDMEALLAAIPQKARLNRPLALADGMTEEEVVRYMRALASDSVVFQTIFRGAGAYRHFIPAAVRHITQDDRFVTAYTPYQAEMSQGVLQSIFEYQTMLCELTGMDVSNASVYDGATAAAEAFVMCLERQSTRIWVSAGLHPDTIEVVRTYMGPHGIEVLIAPEKDGVTDTEAWKALLRKGDAALCVQSPNYYGLIEPVAALASAAHEAGLKLIESCNPISLALYQTPASLGADIAVGEGQPLGMPLSFGGPYLGFMCSTEKLMRRLPGRIVGQTTDHEGRPAYVLTLQAREQHIRREKATSSICSNQALCALTASVYLAAMGPEGLREVAVKCVSNAHYLANELQKLGFQRRHGGEFFHEFVTECPICAQKLSDTLAAKGTLIGLPIEQNGILWCATECLRKEDMDQLIANLKEALQ